MIREDGKLPDGLELFIGERINEALQDSEARKRRYCEALEAGKYAFRRNAGTGI